MWATSPHRAFFIALAGREHNAMFPLMFYAISVLTLAPKTKTNAVPGEAWLLTNNAEWLLTNGQPWILV